MSVPQFTTPTFSLTFAQEGLDLTQAHNVYVTFRSGCNLITKSGSDVTIAEKSIGVYLAQQDTAKFLPGEIKIQANWTTRNGGRVASEVVSYPITEQLLKRVVE